MFDLVYVGNYRGGYRIPRFVVVTQVELELQYELSHLMGCKWPKLNGSMINLLGCLDNLYYQ